MAQCLLKNVERESAIVTIMFEKTLYVICVINMCNCYAHMPYVQLSPHTHIHQSIGAGKIYISCLSSFQPF